MTSTLLRLHRRALLKSLGTLTLLASSPAWLTSRKAHAGTEPMPKRVVFFFGGSGSMPSRWEPTALNGQPAPTLTSWELGELHRGFAPYKSELNYFENLDMVSSILDTTPATNAHLDGQTHAMFGVGRSTGSLPGGISIDQWIAQQMHANGPVTRLRSLELLAASWSNGDPLVESCSASSAGALLPFTFDSRTAYDRIFPPGTNIGGETEEEDPLIKALREKRMRALAFSEQQFQQWTPRLTGADKEKLEQHRYTINDLRSRLGLTHFNGRGQNQPDRSMLDILNGIPIRWDISAEDKSRLYNAIATLQIKLTAAAMHCDVTRVATLHMLDAPDATCGYTPGDFSSTDFHDLIHKVMDSTSPQSQNPDAVACITRMHTTHHDYFKILLDELASKIEPDGTRLLDNTLVVYVSQIANGGHSTSRLPWLTAGNLQGTLKTGRFVTQNRQNGRGRSHNDLFLTVAHAMGYPIETFGMPEACTGPISELFT